MNTYIVTFDIDDPERLTEIKKFLREDSSGVGPIHKNAWAVRSEKRAKDIRNEIIKKTSAEDRIFVIRSGTEAAWKNSYGKKNNDWLKKYL